MTTTRALKFAQSTPLADTFPAKENTFLFGVAHVQLRFFVTTKASALFLYSIRFNRVDSVDMVVKFVARRESLITSSAVMNPEVTQYGGSIGRIDFRRENLHSCDNCRLTLES